jgi:protein-S-isoprenylcysteine O-methyltransferase Ste14
LSQAGSATSVKSFFKFYTQSQDYTSYDNSVIFLTIRGRLGLSHPMDSPTTQYSEHPAVIAPTRRRQPSELLRKRASWLIVALLLPAWFYLPKSQVPVLKISADALGLLMVSLAMIGRLWCALYIAGRKNAELCQDGPYSLVRNPLYVFSFIGTLGVLLATHRWGLLPLVTVAFLVYYHITIRAEEARLARLFPQSYAAYCQEVPRGIPRGHGHRTRTQLTLDPRAVTRAMREVIWFPIAFAAVATVSRLT